MVMDFEMLDILCHRYAWVALGFIFFRVSSELLNSILPEHITCNTQTWKWKNAANSLVHSIITGVGSLYGFYLHPAMAEDLLTDHTTMALRLVALSLGYFMYDFYDMARYHRKASSFELMGHHMCVILCFGLAVVTEMYVGYAMVALLVEVNSVFLHLRQLHVVEGRGRQGGRYRAIALCNVATFLVFRIAVLGWMVRWLVGHSDVVSTPVVTLGALALAVIMTMNIVLFHRVCSVDFRGATVSKRGPNVSTVSQRDLINNNTMAANKSL